MHEVRKSYKEFSVSSSVSHKSIVHRTRSILDKNKIYFSVAAMFRYNNTFILSTSVSRTKRG